MKIIDERDKTHGNYQTQSGLAQKIKRTLRQTPNWDKLNEPQAEAIEAIAVKLARILCGDINHKDHWVDIQGYAFLGGDYSPMIPGMPKAPDFTAEPFPSIISKSA
jgi:hypothetical protein